MTNGRGTNGRTTLTLLGNPVEINGSHPLKVLQYLKKLR